MIINSDPLIVHRCRVVRVAVNKIIDLRHQVLRPGLPQKEARFNGDEDSDTHHFAAYLDVNDAPIGCVSLMQSAWHGEAAWQLRGMAVEQGYRERGIGKQLLQQSEAHLSGDVRYDHVRLIWCNARESAVRFYQHNGWETASNMFVIPTVGRHLKMTRRF